MTQHLHNTEGGVRCKNCNKLVAKVLTDGQFEVKCSRCSTLNAIFEQSPKKIFVVGLEGHILFLSEAMEHASGYLTEEAIGKKPSDLWGRNKPPEFYRREGYDISCGASIRWRKKTISPAQVSQTKNPLT